MEGRATSPIVRAEPDGKQESMPSEASGVVELVRWGWEQMKLQRPLAAWAAWQRALREAPGDRAAREALEILSGCQELPAAARGPYRLRSPKGGERRARWDEAFREAGAELGDPESAARVFADLARADRQDADALYNVAVCLAWSGRNAQAIVCLDQFVDLVASVDVAVAADAWTLAEVLRHGGGAEGVADQVRCRFEMRWPEDPALAARWLEKRPEVVEKRGPIDPETGKEARPGVRWFEWLDRPLPEPSGELDGAELPRLRALVMVEPGRLRFSSPDPVLFREFEEELARGFGDRIEDRRAMPLPFVMLDQPVASFRLPEGLDAEQRRRLSREAVEHYFETIWIGQPRHGLAGRREGGEGPRMRSPAEVAREASWDASARARLEGIVRFFEQLAERPCVSEIYQGYPFDRLRRRLGLEPMAPDTLDAADLSCASAAELERIDPSTLEESQLVEAWKSAMGVGANTSEFARELGRRNLTLVVGDRGLLRDYLGYGREGMEAALGRLEAVSGLVASGRYRVKRSDLIEEEAEILEKEGDKEGLRRLAKELLAGHRDEGRHLRRLGELLWRSGAAPSDECLTLIGRAAEVAEAGCDLPLLAECRCLIEELRGGD